MQWLESKFCEWDGYVIMVTFTSAPDNTRYWWPMNSDRIDSSRVVGTPCWSRREALNQFASELTDPKNRGLELSLHKYTFNKCRGTISSTPTEIVMTRRMCKYQ